MVSALGLSACGSDDAPVDYRPPIRAELPRVVYRSDTDLSTCPNAPARVQRRIEVLEEVLQTQGSPQITYNHFARPEDANRIGNCPRSASDCVAGSSVFSAAYVHVHEIAHTVATPNGGGLPLLSEGLATALSNGEQYDTPRGRDWRQAWQERNVCYVEGAVFAAHLYRTYGPTKLVELLRKLPMDLSPEEFAEEFQEEYSASVDEVWAEAALYPHGVLCVGLEDNADLNGAESNPQPAQCHSSRDSARHIWTIDRATTLAVETTYIEPNMMSCDSRLRPPAGVNVPFDGPLFSPSLSIATWQPQTYYTNLLDSAGTESFRITQGNWIGSECSTVQPFRTTVAPERFALSVNQATAPWVAVEWTGTEELRYGLLVDGMWESCRSCDQCGLPVPVLTNQEPLVIAPGITIFHALQPSRAPENDGYTVLMGFRHSVTTAK